MKKSFLGLLMIIPGALFAQTATRFQITGQLKNVEAGWVYLIYSKDGRQNIDSAKVNNGTYVLNGEVSESNPASLLDASPMAARPLPKDIANIYLAPESFAITHFDSFSHSIITGSTINTDFKKLQEDEEPYNKKEMAMFPAYQAAREAKDDSTAKAIEQKAKAIDAAIDDSVYAPYVRNNPHSPLALYVLQLYAKNDLDAQKLQPLFDGISSILKSSKTGMAFQQKLTVASETSIGKVAMDFTQNDTSGKPVTLSSFKGKYVLLDFWASWCRPCRAENPNVVSAYVKYHPKGFTILSVSLDRPSDKDKWLAAINADGLTWTHVSDLQFWNNAVAKAYGVQSIPQNFLIDPQGKIIGKGLRGEELEKVLSDIYKN